MKLTTLNFFTGIVDKIPFSLVIRVLLILIIGIPVTKFLLKLIMRLVQDRFSAQAELIVKRAISYTLYLILVIMVLNEFGFKLSALLGAAGILGVAVGFASQTSVSNIISGIFLISERSFVVGDVVQVEEFLGRVESIDLLSIKLKTFDNRMVRIPNENMIKTEVINVTKFPIRRAQIVVKVSHQEDLRRVLDILKDIATKLPDALAEPAPLLLIEGVRDFSVDILFGVWTATPNAVPMQGAMILAVKERFEKESIQIPIPKMALEKA